MSAELAGKVFMVTGGNAGLGKAEAKLLAERGAHVIITSRSLTIGQQAAEEINSRATSGKAEAMQLDLASFASIHAFAKEFLAKGLPLHGLLCNAGVFMPPFSRTEQGFEVSVGVKHFGHHLLLQLLKDKLVESAPSRVVFMSGSAESSAALDWDDLGGTKVDNSGMQQAARANLLVLMDGAEWSKRLQASGVTVLASHPGLAKTGVFGKIDSATFMQKVFKRFIGVVSSLMASTPEQGASPMVYAATAPELANTGFSYWGPGKAPTYAAKAKAGNKLASDEAACTRVFELTEKIIAAADASQ